MTPTEQPLSDEQIRHAIRTRGGIVHSDGNVSFTSLTQFMATAGALLAARDSARSPRFWCNKCGQVTTDANHFRPDGSACQYMGVAVGVLDAPQSFRNATPTERTHQQLVAE